MESPTPSLQLFYSYSHHDVALLGALRTALHQLVHDGLIADWYDGELHAGSRWSAEIAERLEAADVILLLVSPDFLASDFCRSYEMRVALQRDSAGDALVIPILLRPVADWQRTEFGHLTILPRDGRPVTVWGNCDQAYASIVADVRRGIERLQGLRHRNRLQRDDPPDVRDDPQSPESLRPHHHQMITVDFSASRVQSVHGDEQIAAVAQALSECLDLMPADMSARMAVSSAMALAKRLDRLERYVGELHSLVSRVAPQHFGIESERYDSVTSVILTLRTSLFRSSGKGAPPAQLPSARYLRDEVHRFLRFAESLMDQPSQ